MPETRNSYQDVKSVLQGGDEAARIKLARDFATPPEVLYFLAEHGSVAVRRVVAENPSTPAQADAILSRDADVPVRCALARKAVGEGLDDHARRNLWRMGFTVLETLMRDQLVRVRRVLTEALSERADAPHHIIVALARDKEEVVAAPFLQHSPVLNDDDLLSILDDDAQDWARDAVADRSTVSPALSGVLSKDASTGTLCRMVANQNAIIDEPVMDGIVERARGEPELQEPLVVRPGLSSGVLARLARFVVAPLLGALRQRADVDPDTARQIDEAIETRDDNVEPPSDELIALALDNGDAEFVIQSLAQRAGFTMDKVRRMLAANSARTVVSLAWKAGLGARFALDLQRQLARIQPSKMINARNGTDFALDPAEMTEQLAMFA